jgi:glycosyltransferase involved in cell wall biosynthesis
MVCHFYPPHVGGIENVVHDEAVRLVELGHEVVVLTSDGHYSRVVEDGVTVVRVAAWNGLERRAGVPFPVFSPSLLVRAWRWVGWADVVHVHDCFYLTSWTAGLAAVLRRTPSVLTQHVAMVEHPAAAVMLIQKLVYGIAGRGLVRRARRVFTINDHVAAFVAELGASRDKVVVLENGVDENVFRPAVDERERAGIRRSHGLPLDRDLVLFVGRLVPKKGIDLLLEAADPDYDLVIVGSGGDGVHRDRPNVHRLGGLSARAVAEVYRACDVFALPTTGEVFTLVVKEAMSSALPVVTTDEPGYSRYDLDETTMELVPRDTAAIRTALADLVRDGAQRAAMGGKARKFAVERFSWTEHVDTLVDHYRSAVEEAR